MSFLDLYWQALPSWTLGTMASIWWRVAFLNAFFLSCPERKVPRTCNATSFSLRKEELSGEPSGLMLSEVSQMENRYRRTLLIWDSCSYHAPEMEHSGDCPDLQEEWGIYCRAKLLQGWWESGKTVWMESWECTECCWLYLWRVGHMMSMLCTLCYSFKMKVKSESGKFRRHWAVEVVGHGLPLGEAGCCGNQVFSWKEWTECRCPRNSVCMPMHTYTHTAHMHVW